MSNVQDAKKDVKRAQADLTNARIKLAVAQDEEYNRKRVERERNIYVPGWRRTKVLVWVSGMLVIACVSPAVSYLLGRTPAEIPLNLAISESLWCFSWFFWSLGVISGRKYERYNRKED